MLNVCNSFQGEVDNKSNNDINEDTTSIIQPPHKLAPSDCKVSEMSAESIIWLSHRLGPVLTARYLSRNLLRMLTLCYAGRDNLTPVLSGEFNSSMEEFDWNDNTMLVGDRNATKVLECLKAIAGWYNAIRVTHKCVSKLLKNLNIINVSAGLYGEQIIVLQYFAHVGELLALCKRKLTSNLEGGLVSCLALLTHIIPCLSDSTLMDCLHVRVDTCRVCSKLKLLDI